MSKAETPEHHRDIRTFGRRDGRPLSKRQKGLMETLLPHVQIPDGTGPLNAAALFSDDRPIWLEIGFGGGEHLIEQARRNPDVGFVGAEPFIEGVAKALTGIDTHSLTNVRLLADDVRLLLERFEDHSVDRVFILFPDPWPKRRQQKRRLIQPAFLDQLAQIVRPGSEIRFATDVKSYADEALWHFERHPDFNWDSQSVTDWAAKPADHITTRYESKRLGDCSPVWLNFNRN